MEIYSGLTCSKINIHGWETLNQEVVVAHRGLYDYIQEMHADINVSYNVLACNPDHAVVLCTLKSKSYNREITEIGETCKNTLDGAFKFYPVTTAYEIAFDRAVIKFLVLPSNTYSSLERIKSLDIPPAGNRQGEPCQYNGKPDAGDYRIEIGTFQGMVVRDVFNRAKVDSSIEAALRIYLSKDSKIIADSRERFMVTALKTYQQRLQESENGGK